MRREIETRLQKLEAQRSGSRWYVVSSEQEAMALKASGVVKSGDRIVITGVPRPDGRAPVERHLAKALF